MRSITGAVCLSLLGTVAMAQTPGAAQPPKPPVPQASAPQMPEPQAPGGIGPDISGPGNNGPQNNGPQVRVTPGQGGLDGALSGPGAGQSGPPEGEIIETPNGFYLVRPGRKGQQLGATGDQPAAQPGPMDDGAMAEDDMPPPPPRGRPRPQGPMPDGKGARLRIHAPNLDIDMKCPDDESMKVCVDSVTQLLDKAAAQPHP
jgi:hypothetical protein